MGFERRIIKQKRGELRLVEKKKRRKEELVEEVEVKSPKEGVTRVRYNDKYEYPTFGQFPKAFWKEYEKDCKENYGDIRWAKAWNDHIIARQHKKEEAMLNLIVAQQMSVKQEVVQEEKKENDEEDGVKTIGGIVK